MSFIIVYITNKDRGEAKKIGDHLLNKKLVACVNYLPIESTYLWEGKVENSDEIVSLVKSRKENWDKIKEEVKKVHSYKTPCIIKFEVEANEGYEKWVKEETNG